MTTRVLVGISDVHSYVHDGDNVTITVRIAGVDVSFVGVWSDVQRQQYEMAMFGRDSRSRLAEEAHAARKPIPLNDQVDVVYDYVYDTFVGARQEVWDKYAELLRALELATEKKLYGPRYVNNCHVLISRLDACLKIVRS